MEIEDISDIPTEVLETLYYQIWAELMERGLDFEEITRH
jgi:hypothetical protein